MSGTSTLARRSIFIGSSVEGLPVAEQFREQLLGTAAPTIWYDVFKPGNYNLEALETALEKHSCALIILSPDDITKSRGTEEISARDNAIFELGLFMGRHGRRSAFIAIPEMPKVRLPTDVWGLVAVTYRVKGETYDVTDAVREIIDALETAPIRTGRRAYERPSMFWDVMRADTILILYGVEPEIDPKTHAHPRVSLRDLETSLELKTFLDRRYPAKRVLLVPASSLGWERRYPNADLVIVGGFITNAEFAQHRTRYENLVRLRMGRLCIVDGQRVHIPEFDVLGNQALPNRSDAQAIENMPTQFTTRDYGAIFSGLLKIYGNDRRVVAIAGVKGHGTRGAAIFLYRDNGGIEEHLTTPLQPNETVEAAVAVEVTRDLVGNVTPIIVRRNHDLLIASPAAEAVECELGHPCQGCEFGLLQPARPKLAKLIPSKIKALVFDLDDTLIDTYGTLITPLESRAAAAMIEAGATMRDPTTLACVLLQIRRAVPFDVWNELRRVGFGCSQAAFAKRKELLEKVSLDHLFLSPEIAHLLRRLSYHFELHLLTSGSPEFQNAKIDQLQIRPYFSSIAIVSNGSYRVKARALKALALSRRLGFDSMLIVGNRLDQEIAAANLLGMPTVWIKHGEGCEMLPSKGRGEPDFVLENIVRLPSLLWE